MLSLTHFPIYAGTIKNNKNKNQNEWKMEVMSCILCTQTPFLYINFFKYIHADYTV